jgi:hypothetical protein
MSKDGKEPQSYGSGKDWVTGRTGQQVHDQKGIPAPEHRPFYDDRRESETSDGDQGGKVSDAQLADAAHPQTTAPGDHAPVTGVTSAEGGTKRDGYFKKRDYE